MSASEVTATQSIVLLRNLMRLAFGHVLWSRGSFEEDAFTTGNVNGLNVHRLGSTPNAPDTAKRLIGYMEHGVFDALNQGYLEKAVLIMSADEAAEEVLEAWQLSIAWTADSEGVEHPTLKTSSKSGDRAEVQLACKKRYTMEYARGCSEALLRQLSAMLERMPPMTSTHWLSMKLLYREDKTPADYAPTGFVPIGDVALHFQSRPLQMTVPTTTLSTHNALELSVVSAGLGDAEDEGAHVPAGVSGGGSAFLLDLGAGTPSETEAWAEARTPPPLPLPPAMAPPPAPDAGDVDRLMPEARRAIALRPSGAALPAADLAAELGTTRRLAIELLAVAEDECLARGHARSSRAAAAAA